MIVYDGTYRLQLDTGRGLNPGPTRICTWRVRIINLTDGQPAVRHLKPTIVIAHQTGSATSLISCAEAVGKKISLDFKLDIKKVCWIELIPNKPGQWYAAVFTPKSESGSGINYRVDWRPARPTEINLIMPFIPDIDDP
jgi:hypothetical protein